MFQNIWVEPLASAKFLAVIGNFLCHTFETLTQYLLSETMRNDDIIYQLMIFLKVDYQVILLK